MKPIYRVEMALILEINFIFYKWGAELLVPHSSTHLTFSICILKWKHFNIPLLPTLQLNVPLCKYALVR